MVTIHTILLNKEDCFVLEIKSSKFLPPFSTLNCRIFLKFSITLLVILRQFLTIKQPSTDPKITVHFVLT